MNLYTIILPPELLPPLQNYEKGLSLVVGEGGGVCVCECVCVWGGGGGGNNNVKFYILILSPFSIGFMVISHYSCSYTYKWN